MALSWIDWLIIAAYLVLSLGIGVWYSRRASGSVAEFFAAGRSLPWWIAGTSMVATTFAADTPLAVTGFIRREGIYGNWFLWSGAIGGVLCAFFFAMLWRRARILTDAEFIELRYAGKPAAVLRGAMAGYSGIIYNCVVMGWVILAMTKVATVVLGLGDELTVGLGDDRVNLPAKPVLVTALILVAVAYTVLSGLWGVVVTDLVQFAIAMAGATLLAVLVVDDMGGLDGMLQRLHAMPDFRPETLHIVPDLAQASQIVVFTFLVYMAVQSWVGSPCGGYQAQRLFACRDERQAMLSSLWFNFANYVIRSWPWTIVAIASLAYFPRAATSDQEAVYAHMMVRFLPAGLLGLGVVAFLAAFMSTIDTHLNWGASYVVVDIYKRFIRKEARPEHYVLASRLIIVGLMILGGLMAWQMQTIAEAWMYLGKLTAGLGVVAIFRWYWWRINVWSELSALGTSLVLANVLPLIEAPGLGRLGSMELYPVELTIIVIVSTAVWLPVTLLTPPVKPEHLAEFYRRVRPGGWWRPVERLCPDVQPRRARRGWVGWASGVICIYSGLFGLGYLLLGPRIGGAVLVAVCIASGIVAVRQIGRVLR